MAKGWSFGALTKAYEALVASLGELANWNKNKLYDAMYPVGITILFNIDSNPNDAFPGTTWTQLTDYGNLRTSTGSLIGQTQGADLITITVNNLPAHNHGWSGSVASTDLGNRDTTGSGDHHHEVHAGTSGVGDHTHHIDFWTDTQGQHNHYIPGNIATQDGNTNAISGGRTGIWSSNKTTSDSGAHSHHVVGDTQGAGGHSHSLDAATTGAMGWGNNGNHYHTVSIGAHAHGVSGTVGNTGGGQAINTAGRVHNVSAWVRTK
jgi:hypothetical protein